MPEDTKPRTYRKLSNLEWLQVVNLARQGTKVAQIASTYGVHPTVIYKGLKTRGVIIGDLIKQAAAEAADKERDKLIEKIKETREYDYSATQLLQKLVVSKVTEQHRSGGALGMILDDVKTLKIALDAIAKGTDNKWRLLGLDKENENADSTLPELPIRELTQEEVHAIRHTQAVEDGEVDADEMDELTDGLTPADLAALENLAESDNIVED